MAAPDAFRHVRTAILTESYGNSGLVCNRESAVSREFPRSGSAGEPGCRDGEWEAFLVGSQWRILTVLAAGMWALALTPPTTAATSPAGTITSIAGGPGGPGLATTVAQFACGVRVAGTSLYIGNFGNVQRVNTSSGQLTTVAGNQASSGGGNGAAALKVPLHSACGTAVDSNGNLVIADGRQVQVVASGTGTFYGQQMTAGHIYSIAGQPNSDRSGGVTGDGGPATKANLFSAVGVAFDHAGNLVIADSGLPQNCGDCTPLGALVRVVAARTGAFYGQQMTAGDIYTVAGTSGGPGPAGYGGPAVNSWLGPTIGAVRLDAAGNLLIADNGENDVSNVFIAPSLRVVAVKTGTFYGRSMTAGDIYRLAGTATQGTGGDGGPAIKAPLESAGGVAVDATGNLLIADYNRVRVIAVKTGTFYGQPMTAGDIYGIAGLSSGGFSGDGGPATSARVEAGVIAIDSAGNVVFGGGFRVRVVAPKSGTFYGRPMTAGDIYTVAGNGRTYSGDGGLPTRASFSGPSGVTEDSHGDLAFADPESDVIWVVMASSGTFFGRKLAAGDSYAVAGQTKAQFDLVGGAAMTFDPAGNLVVADANADLVQVIAVRTGTFYGQPMTAGGVYTVAGTAGRAGFSGDGGPATKAELNYPIGVSADRSGNLLVADAINRRVRVVAAATGTFYGQHMIAGDIYTIAGDGNAAYSGDGGPATKAGVSPADAVPDASGNLVIADGVNSRVRLLAARTGTFYGQSMTAGDIYTIAGSGNHGLSGNGGPALDAAIGFPEGVAVDGSGNIAIADESDSVVWVVAATSATFFGQSMTLGHIYIVAGNGTSLGTDGIGDGGPGTQAALALPSSVTFDPAGDLLVGDQLSGYIRDGRIRSVSR